MKLAVRSFFLYRVDPECNIKTNLKLSQLESLGHKHNTKLIPGFFKFLIAYTVL